MITITEMDVMDTMIVAELSDGRTIIAGLLNPRTDNSGVAVFNARGKRARIGDVHSGSDMQKALGETMKLLNNLTNTPGTCS